MSTEPMDQDQTFETWRNHSTLWVLLLFTGFLNWGAFLYIGLRVRRPLWLVCAALYAAPVLAVMLASSLPAALAPFVWPAFFASAVVSLTHGFAAESRFLHRLADQADDEAGLKRKFDRLRQRQLGAERVDVNTATAAELMALPGIGAVEAELAVTLRASRGGFASPEAFLEALGLSGERAARLRPLLWADHP
ncbi:MAG: ComEA family DNA-binding protein [Candidatus Sericytochromatia bacterium]